MHFPGRKVGLYALLPAIIVAGLCLAAPKSRINNSNFERIQIGMTIDEVTAILGQESSYMGPCGDSCCWRDGPNWISATSAAAFPARPSTTAA